MSSRNSVDEEAIMNEISRRGFLKGAQVSLVAAGIAAVSPMTMSTVATAATIKTGSTASKDDVHALSTTETVVVHIPNPRTGEIRLMVGEKEIIRHDRALVARLIRDFR